MERAEISQQSRFRSAKILNPERVEFGCGMRVLFDLLFTSNLIQSISKR